MSKAAKSVVVFGIYLVVLGLALLIVPNALLTLFAYPTTNEVWIRVVGLLVLVLGYYYIEAARSELRVMFKASVRARPALIVFFTILVALGHARPVLVLFGAIDLLAAIWTALALRSSD